MAELRGSQPTLLVGSAISSFAPTGIPAGMAIGEAIAARMAECRVSGRERLVEILKQTAFEHIMERCPAPDRVREALSVQFRSVSPNPVHEALARLAKSGVIRHLVTPNYDVGIEAAFGKISPETPLALVRDREEAYRVSLDAPHVLFKIHGCATEPFARGMAFRLADEAQLEPWKRETLRNVVEGRPLAVAAYSGKDFEICPELPRMGASRVVWLHLGKLKWMTPNACRVVRESGAVVLRGSIQELAGALLGEGTVSASWSPGAAKDFVTDLFARFDEEELDSWRARLFGEIGCANDAVGAADRLLARAEARGDTVAWARALSHRARGHFHQGRYIDAADEYARAARVFQAADDPHELRGALGGIIECNRCAGRLGRRLLGQRALGRLVRAEDEGLERAPARADQRMYRFLLRRHFYQVASHVPQWPGLRRPRDWVRSTLRERARRDLAAVAEYAATVGNWLQFQQTSLWTEDYDLAWRDVYQGPLTPLPSRDGYRQLGYVVAHSMAIRRAKAAPNEKEVRTLLESLVDIGAWPEAWKLLRFAERRLAPSDLPPGVRSRIDAGWQACQYTLWMRGVREIGLF